MSSCLVTFLSLMLLVCCSDDEKNAQADRKNFLKSKRTIEKSEKGARVVCFGGKCLTNLHEGSIPRTIYLADYDTTWLANVPKLMSCFPNSFLVHLPQKIRDALKEHQVSDANTTLCWNVQLSSGMGNFGTDRGVSTRMKAHGWASPDAPPDNEIKGDLVNRNFLFGIFEPYDPMIATADLKIDQLLSFPVNTHSASPGHAPISPPGMARVAITSSAPSQSFWSLVIDNDHPTDTPLRAAVTFHWVCKSYEPGAVQRLKELMYERWQKEPVDFKSLVLDLKSSPVINDHKMMQSLKKLLGDVWDEIEI